MTLHLSGLKAFLAELLGLLLTCGVVKNSEVAEDVLGLADLGVEDLGTSGAVLLHETSSPPLPSVLP